MIDFTSEGPYFTRINETTGQPFDLDQLDDVNSWIIAIARRDKPEDIKRALENDEWVLNYGVYFVFRNQAYDAIVYENRGDPGDLPSKEGVENYAIRSAEAYIPDVWVRFMWQKLRVEMELVMIAGKIGYEVSVPARSPVRRRARRRPGRFRWFLGHFLLHSASARAGHRLDSRPP